MHARLLRVPIASAGMVATLAAIAWAHHREYPAQHWLAWRYAAYLGAATLWLAGCAGTGARLVRALLARHVPALELGSLGLAAGLFTFQLTTFALGLLGALHWAALVAVSVAMLVVGRSELRRAAVTVRRVARRPPAPRSLGALGALALGLGGLGLVYFAALAPESVSFDARWRHLVLAESYAAARHIGRYPEGWVFAASPHFSSLTFVPAFALPGLALFDRMALAVHFEWVVFAATTVLGVAALARRLAPRAPASVWAVRLLFPGVLVYDATVSGGIDHLGATYAPAAVLAMLDCLRPAPRSPGAPGYPPPNDRGATSGSRRRPWILLGALLGGAACAKETTLILVVVPAVVVVALVLAWRVFTRVERAGAAGAALALTGAVALAAWAPHWLKNLVWYGDPLYPTLHAWLPARPWSADAARLWAEVFLPTQLARPAPGAAGLRDAAAALATFAIVPNDYAGFHRSVPVFGFLFTALTLPAALLLGPERRLRLALAWCYVAIAAWYLTSHRDRYLQAIVPVMSAVTGAALVSLWRAPPAKRLRPLLIVLVGAQLVTSGDAYFLPTHALHRGASAGATMRLLGAGFQRNYAERFAVQTDLVALGASLPRGARVLLHESHDLLGTGARVSTDLPAEQAGIDYPSWGATARIARGLRELGFTHVAWRAGRIGGHLPVAADLLFLDLVRGLERSTTTAGAWRVAPLPAGEGADAGEEAWVDVHTCAGALHYPPGRYRVTDLSRSPLLRDAAPRTPRGPAGSGAPAGYLVIDRRCAAAVPTAGYARLGGRPERSAEPYELWRREGGSLP